MTYAIPIIGFLIGLPPGVLLARKGRPWVVGLLLALALAAGGWMFLAGRGQDGVGYGMVVMMMMLPAIAGLVAGTIWGLVARMRGGKRAAADGGTR